MVDPFKPKARPESEPEVEQPRPTWAQIVTRGRLPKPSSQKPATQEGPSQQLSPPRPPPRQPATDQGPIRHPLLPKPPPQRAELKQPQPPAQQISAQQPAATPSQNEGKTSRPTRSQQSSLGGLPDEPLSFKKPVDQSLRRSIAYLLRFEQAHPGFGIDNTIVTRSVFATEVDTLGCAIDKIQALVAEHGEGYDSDEEENSGVWVQGEELIHHKVVLRVEIVAVRHPWRTAYY